MKRTFKVLLLALTQVFVFAKTIDLASKEIKWTGDKV
ncbi:hypothetical protein M901_2229, partial [Bacteriovorax sp. DB6_IX]